MAGEIVLAALRAILAALRPLRVQAVLVGGLGIQSWGRIRQTKDVDLLVGASGIDNYLRTEADRELLRPELDRLEQEARTGA